MPYPNISATPNTSSIINVRNNKSILHTISLPEKLVADKGTEYYTDFQEMLSDLGIQYRLVPVESPWQLGMVERHGGVLGDIVHAVVNETGAVGFAQMRDVCLHASMAKNR